MRQRGSLSVIRVIAALATAAAATPAPSLAGNEALVRQHLDAGRVQFSGMDINGDDLADSIRVDRIKRSLFYFVGDKRGNFRSFDPATLPEEERRFVPDLLIEKDLDGDEIDDLILCNREYVEKYRDNEQTLARILTASIFIGQPKGAYLSLRAAAHSDESQNAAMGRARKLIFPVPDRTAPANATR